MITINFTCNDCGSHKGRVEAWPESVIVCEECEESEQIKDFDIAGNEA